MKRFFTLAALSTLALLTGCVNGPIARSRYDVTVYKPKNPDNVRIKVSLSNRAVYVLEGDTPLLVTACAIGKPTNPTPTGSYRINGKIPTKRSGEYGFSVSGDSVHPSKASEASGHYVGFPMAWWCEFTPGYGFHEGSVWPIPRTHGCIRLHHNVAPKFYALAKMGTPVNIAQSQPEDATIGKDLKRPGDYADPDPAPSIMITDRVFSKPTEPLLVERP
ncbi:MAG: L,D-transpeptidase [Chthoniobacter sp.]|uniref:L,D-transpeptidase n=1 Tax=Chthoniobacter sp. TaxID=2510640 RepID=UPI0032A9762E